MVPTVESAVPQPTRVSRPTGAQMRNSKLCGRSMVQVRRSQRAVNTWRSWRRAPALIVVLSLAAVGCAGAVDGSATATSTDPGGGSSTGVTTIRLTTVVPTTIAVTRTVNRTV